MIKVVWEPNSGRQTSFCASGAREVLYGGAVGGGKTDGLIALGLKWHENKRYRGIILRRIRKEQQEVIDRANELIVDLYGTRGREFWRESRSRWEFPSGAFFYVGCAEHEQDIHAFKTFQYSYIAFDELTTFTQYQYLYMLSRNRVPAGVDIPLMMRSGTNPDGPGHVWVFKRFVEGKKPGRIYRYLEEVEHPIEGVIRLPITRQFIPSTVFDNPKLGDRDSYIAGLKAMKGPVAEALLYGRWDVFQGQAFPYEIESVEAEVKAEQCYWVRCLDYGWSDPTVVYWLVVYPFLEPDQSGLPLVEVARELVVSETSVDGIVHYINEIERRLKIRRFSGSVIDPSAAKTEGTSQRSIMDMFTQRGIWFEKAISDRQSGWAMVRRFLEAGRLRVWSGKAPALLDTLPKLIRDPNKKDDILPKQNDHPADTIRYGLQCVGGLGRAVVVSDQERVDPSKQDTKFEEHLRKLRSGRGGEYIDSLGEGW
jgi:hypothetical protein